MANKTVYPFGTGGQLPSSIGIINDLITGGADKALSAEMGKELNETIINKFPIPLTMETYKAIRRDGNEYTDSSSDYSASGYVSIDGFDAVIVSTNLRVSVNEANDIVVAFYDANKVLINILDPRLLGGTGERPVVDYYFSLRSNDAKYARVSNFKQSITPALFGVKAEENVCTYITPTTWIKGWTGTRKYVHFPVRHITANGADTLKVYAKCKAKSGTQISITLFSKGYTTWWQIAPDSQYYDTGYVDEFNFDEFDISEAESVQFRILNNNFTSSTTDDEINAVFEDLLIGFVQPKMLNDEPLAEQHSAEELYNITQHEIDELEKPRPTAYNVLSINHRGYNTIAPENTMPAYRLSVQKGFKIVETDVQFTSDGVAVLLHDQSINRTARNADGSAISETTYIRNITYEQALEYDFGIWKSAEYAGTKIPTLQEFIKFCRCASIHPYIELKNTLTQAQTEQVVSIVNANGMRGKVTYISFGLNNLTYVKNVDAKARLGYVISVVCTSSHITDAQGLMTGYNDVFIDSDKTSSEALALCQNAGIPHEMWTIDSEDTILALDPYISGVTSNVLIAGDVLYDSLGL